MKTEVIVRRSNSNDELMHAGHKYIDRKWKNGKWIYTYEVDKTDQHGRKIGKETKSVSGHYNKRIFENQQFDKESIDLAKKEARGKAERSSRAQAMQREKKKLKRNLPLVKAKKAVQKGQKFFKKLFE